MADTDAPPAPAAVTPETPVQAYAEPPALPAPEPEPVVDDTVDEPRQRRPRRRGVPIEPLVIGAGNGTTLAATYAYTAAGTAGLVAAAGTAAALVAGGALQRRRTVRRRITTGAGRPRSGAGASGRGRGRGGASGALSGRGALGRGGAGRRGGSSGAWGAGRGGASPRTSGRSGRGALGLFGGRGAGRFKSPRLPGGVGAGSGKGKHKRPRGGILSATTPSTTPRKNRTRSRLGMLRPAASAARRGMANTGRVLRATGRGIARPARAVGRAGRRTFTAGRALWRRTAGARRAAARRTGRAVAAVWDGALAGLAGLGSALRHRSLRGGLAKLRAVWTRRRRKRAADRAAAGPVMTGPEIASAPAPVALSVRRPTTVGGTPSTYGGSAMSGGHHFLAGAMELERVATTYTPDGMMQVGRDFAALPEALEHVANAMRISTARADAEQPLDPRIVEIMGQIYRLQMKASELARELGPAFRKLHDVDIQRIENPRKGRHAEAMWDVRANSDTSL